MVGSLICSVCIDPSILKHLLSVPYSHHLDGGLMKISFSVGLFKTDCRLQWVVRPYPQEVGKPADMVQQRVYEMYQLME